MASASLSCILCFSILTKANDRNLVGNSKGQSTISKEIEDLHFVVHSTSQHICRACLRTLQQRQNYKKKLDDINSNLLRQYREKAGQKGLTVKTKAIAKRSLSFDQNEHPITLPTVREGESTHICSPSTAEYFQPKSNSTPRRQAQHKNIDNVSSPQGTTVSVKVQWKSKTASRILPEDLESLGKMLCRGTYTQVARAAWRCEKVREQIIILFLKEIDRECTAMCSKKNPSILRKTSKEDIVNFSLTKLDGELKERTPLLRSVLMAASIRKSTLERTQLYWMPAVCMASSICMKNRSPYMTVVQLLNTIFIQHSGLMVCY